MLGLALLLLVTVAPPAVAAGIDRLLAEPAPLVLKDGRIARVSVFAIRFPTSSAELDPDTARSLEALIEDEATDCFLTAQAIGHAEAPAADAGDTLAEHRLARARADRVQRIMVDHGLAATAIASVWDWQFVVKEPRVTLWIFDLPTGSDCKGTRLDHPRPVASAAPEAEATAVPEAEATAAPEAEATASAAQGARPSPPAPPSAPSSSPPAPAGAMQPPAAPVASQPSEPTSESPTGPASPPSPTPGQTAASEPPPSMVQASPTTSATTAAPAEETPAATVPPPESASPAPATPTTQESATSEETPPAEAAGAAGSQKAPEESVAPAPEVPPPAPPDAAPPRPAPAVAAREPSSATTASVPFDVNSSFLSKAATERLREIAAVVRGGGRFTIELTASVGGEVKDASGQQADRYNHWMAERRIGRVTDWLRQNSGSATLEFKSGFVTQSGPPQIEVKLEPAG
jgi:outer membrane protein OmpA-like peptidoglycan-associated protein